MSEQASVVVEVKLLDLPQVLRLIDSAVATITALATALDNTNEEIIRLRAQIAPEKAGQE